MIAGLKPYPTMKDSCVEWLGEVPAHWEVKRLRNTVDMRVSNVDKKSHPGERPVRLCNYVNVYNNDLISQRLSFMKATASPVDAERFRLMTGDVLITKDSESWTDIAIPALVTESAPDLVSGYHLALLRPRVEEVVGGYLLRVLQSNNLTYQFHIEARGVTRFGLTHSGIKSVWLPLPPPTEQATIIRFLDHADRRIRRYIRAKEKLIALLEEQKQAIIHRAVTGRIDVRTGQPYPAYKPSGVEWLGDVPKIWNTIPLQRVTLDRCDGPFGSGLKSSHYVDEGIRVVRLQNIGHGEFNNSDIAFISPEHYATLSDHSIEPGDVLIAGLGDSNHPAGRACVAPTSIGPAMVKADCFRFRLDRDLADPEFISLQLTATARVASAILSTGATRQRTNLRSTLAKAIAIPSLHQQALIAEYARARALQIDSAKKATKKQIARFHEYRTRLIADAVTGKLDVREAAAALPEVDPLAADDAVDDCLGASEAPAFDGDQEPAEVVG